MDQKDTMVPKVLLENKVIVVNEVNVVNEEKRAFKVTLDVLSVLADHLPIQLTIRYGEEMCFVKYHI